MLVPQLVSPFERGRWCPSMQLCFFMITTYVKHFFFLIIRHFTMMQSQQEEYDPTYRRIEPCPRRHEGKYHDLLHSFKICAGCIYFGFSDQYITVRATSISLFVKKRDWTDSDRLNRERLEVRAVGFVGEEVTHVAQVSKTTDSHFIGAHHTRRKKRAIELYYEVCFCNLTYNKNLLC